MQYIKEITVDLSGKMYFSYITAVQGDEGSRYVKITILSNGETFEIPDGAIATLRCRKPDGTYVLNDATINEDYTITAELTENMLAAVGNCVCEVTLYADDASLTTVPFIVKVTAASVDPDIESSDEYTALTAALNAISGALGVSTSALEIVTDALSLSEDTEEACKIAIEAALQNAKTYLLSLLDGTYATYKDVMRKYYLIGSWNSVTAFCDEWYAVTRPGEWISINEFYQPSVSAVTYGTKTGDDADFTCTPSTDTVKGQDDYEGHPLFAIMDCNFIVDADTLQPVITAIDGVTDDFKSTDPTVYVGVLQMSAWTCRVEADDVYTRIYSANSNVPYSVMPLSEAVNPDGTFRQWVVHAKYPSHTTTA